MIKLVRKLLNFFFKGAFRFSFFQGRNSVSDRVFALFYFSRYRDPFAEPIRFSFLVLVVITSMFGGGYCQAQPIAESGTPVWYDYEVVNVFPHDPKAFTQGLIFVDGFLYESTGLHGHSTVRKVDLYTGEIIVGYPLLPRYFAEGLTIWGQSLVQLTWQAGMGFVYDLRSFKVKRTFTYPGEGWGLTQDGSRLIMSDGTASLRFLDPATFSEKGRLTVTDSGRPLDHLNELEMVKGRLFANIWKQYYIAVIELTDGSVVGKIDLNGILTGYASARSEDVLNGIAYDAYQDRLFVTGKRWPVLFEIKIRHRH